MDILDRVKRTWGPLPALPEDSWKKVEEPSFSGVEELINGLEKAVSNGEMGVAAEVSECLELAAGDILDANPVLRLELEIERVKRFAYMGFEEATKSASERTIRFLRTNREKLPKEHALIRESVAISAVGWFLNDSAKLADIIDECRKIDSQFETPRWRSLCMAFTCALEGRLAALDGQSPKCLYLFEKAIRLCNENGFPLPASHISLHYADGLRLMNDWKGAVRLAKQFLNECCKDPKTPFKSHLLLKAYILLLRAPETIVTSDEFKHHALGYQILLYAAGLARSQTLYPILAGAREYIRTKSLEFEIDYLDVREELYGRIKKLGFEDFERLIKFLHESMEFEVHDLPDHFRAFDLLAKSKLADDATVIGIQVKANVGSAISTRDISDDFDFAQAIRRLKEDYGISQLSEVHWYTIKKIDDQATQRLRLRVKDKCECQLKTFNLDQLVNMLLDKPDLIKRIGIYDEWKSSSEATPKPRKR